MFHKNSAREKRKQKRYSELTIPLAHTISDGIVFLILYCMMFVTLVLFFIAQKKLDRYRLKYGFDRDIEQKGMNGTDEEIRYRLDKAEKRFKRRVFKD